MQRFLRVVYLNEPTGAEFLSEDALVAMRDVLAALCEAVPTDFAPNEHVTRKGSGLRGQLRMMVALFPDADGLDEITARIAYVLDNPLLAAYEIRKVLEGHAGELPWQTTRAMGLALGRGVAWATIAAECGVAERMVGRLAHFLGATVARQQMLARAAVDAVLAGQSERGFAAAAGVSAGTAHKLLKQARQDVDGLTGDDATWN